MRQCRAVNLVKGDRYAIAAAQELADGRIRLSPVTAQQHHILCAEGGTHVRLIQHPRFIHFAGDAPVSGDIDEYALILLQRLIDGGFGQRLPHQRFFFR